MVTLNVFSIFVLEFEGPLNVRFEFDGWLHISFVNSLKENVIRVISGTTSIILNNTHSFGNIF